jgi:hypothetical protein
MRSTKPASDWWDDEKARNSRMNLKNNTSQKLGVKNKRLCAAWNEDYLREILFGK